jgi:hypothetical protein
LFPHFFFEALILKIVFFFLEIYLIQHIS